MDTKHSCPNCGAEMVEKPGGGFMCEYCRYGKDDPKPEPAPTPAPVEAPPEPKPKTHFLMNKDHYRSLQKRWLKLAVIYIIIETVLGVVGGIVYYKSNTENMIAFAIGMLFAIGGPFDLGHKKPVRNSALTFIRPVTTVICIVLFAAFLIGGAALGLFVCLTMAGE